jgi:hypothetical protein
MNINVTNEKCEMAQLTACLEDPSSQFDKKLITLAEASQSLPRFNKRRISIVTLWRWARHGYHGVYLNYSRVGRRIAVTQAALNQFFLDVAKLDADVHGPSNFKPKPRRRRYRSNASRQQELDRAQDILIRAKILQATQD